MLALGAVLVGCPNPTGGFDGGDGAGEPAAAAPLATAGAPVFDPAGGSFSEDITVSLSSATPGATVHYATDGSVPTSGSPAFDPASPIELAGDDTTVTIRALALVPGHDPSGIAEASFAIDYGQVSTPQFDPAPGTFDTDIAVSISTMTSGATIHYETDGSEPTTSSPVFDAASPIAVAGNSSSMTIKAMAVAPGFDDSDTAEGSFTIAYAPAVTPTVTEPPRPWVSERRWWLESSPGATIYYTTDNTAPLDGAGNPTGSAQTYAPQLGVQLTTPDTGATSYTIRAAATGGGFLPSAEFNETYEIIPGRVLSNNLDGQEFVQLLQGLPEGLTVTWREDATAQYVSGWNIRVPHDLTIDSGGFDVVLTNLGFTGGSGNMHIVVGSESDPSVGATLVIRGLTMEGYTTGVRGGAVWVRENSTFIAENLRFFRNDSMAGTVVANAAGGAIANEGTLVVKDSVFVGNKGLGGGAIANFGGTTTIKRSRFLGNTVTTPPSQSSPLYQSGGAILAIDGTVNVVDSYFAGNAVQFSVGIREVGAALSAVDGTINVHGSQIVGHTAEQGVPAHVSGSGTVNISSSAFYDNRTEGIDNPFVPLFLRDTTAAVINVRSSTFVDNTTLSIDRAFTEPEILAPNLLLINTAEGDGDFQNSFVQTGVNAADIFVALPGRGPDDSWGTDDDVAGDFRLRSSADPAIRSGVIDSGDTTEHASDFADADEDSNTTEAEPLDLAGGSRVQGGTMDIGAVEH
jgi:hypothetical protein